MVVGQTLCELHADGSFTNRGAVASDQYPALIFYNGTVGGQLGISSGGNFYSYILGTNTLALQLPGTCTMLAYANGTFFAFNINTGIIELSALNDGTTWPGSTFIQRSLFPDPWQAIFTDQNNLLWTVGTQSFEVYYDTGIGTEPWAPLSGLNGITGIIAPFAFAVTNVGNFWLSQNKHGVGELVFSTGSTPQPVSNYSFDTAVGNYLSTAKIIDAELLAYQQLGHLFINIAFPSANTTWTYDVKEQLFCQRGQWNALNGTFDMWVPRVIIPAFGMLLAGPRVGSSICAMSPNYSTEFDGVTGMVRERTTPGVTQEHARIPIDQLELLIDVGITAAQSGLGSDPQVTLRLSIDGGYTFGNERKAGMGRIGQYMRRVYWQQLGAPPDACFRVRVTDPQPARVLDAWINSLEK